MERRERKRFEPPPWEQWSEGASESAVPEPKRPESGPEAPDDDPELDAALAGIGADDPSRDGRAMRTEAGKPAGERPTKAELDEAKVTAMLAQLAVEEPSATKGAEALTIGAGLFTVLLGFVMVVWGTAGMRRVAAAGGSGGGYLGAGIILGFALLFMAMGVWLLVRSLKQRGDI